MPTSFRWGCDLAWLMPLLQTSPDSEAALSLYTRRKIAERLVGRRVGVLVLSGLALAVFLGAMAYLMGFFRRSAVSQTGSFRGLRGGAAWSGRD